MTRLILPDNILAIVELCRGNVTHIAEKLHVNVRTVFRWVRRYDFVRDSISKARHRFEQRAPEDPIIVDPNDSRGVYAIKSGDFVKIGRTDNVNYRLKQIQTGSPFRLEFLGMLSLEPDDESLIHNRFEHLHYRGEWFRSDPEILQAIQLRKE